MVDAVATSKGERTRRRVLTAAAELLGDHGYHGATLADIAAAASMQAGSLYYHFASKDAIVEEVLQVGIDHASEAIESALDSAPPGATGRERVELAISAYLRSILEESVFTRANIRCYDEVPADIRRRNSKRIRVLTSRFEALYGDGVADGSLRAGIEPAVLVRMVLAALNSCARWLRPASHSVNDVAAMFSTAILDGCATGEPLGDC